MADRLKITKMTREIANLLSEYGYFKVSNRYGIVSRIDRPDWKEYMAMEHSPWSLAEGMKWVECLGNESAADHYRRVYSKDNLQFGHHWSKYLIPSSHRTSEYIPLDIKLLQQRIDIITQDVLNKRGNTNGNKNTR